MKAISSARRPSGMTDENEDDEMEDSEETIAQILEDVLAMNGSKDDLREMKTLVLQVCGFITKVNFNT